MSKGTHVTSVDFRPIGKAIKEARLERGWSRENAAEKLGISSTYLTSIENKGRCPSFKVFVSMLTLFELSADELLFKDHSTQGTTNSSIKIQIEKILQSLSGDELHYVKTCLVALKTLDSKQ